MITRPRVRSAADSTTTAATGANHFDTARYRDINEPILFGLDNNSVTLTRLEIDLSSLGDIGLHAADAEQCVAAVLSRIINT